MQQLLTAAVAAHVVLAFAAIAFLIVPGAILEKIAHTKDVPFIRKAFALGIFHGQIGGPLAMAVALLGVVVAWRGGIPLSSGWLIAAYVTFAVVMGIGIGYHARRETRIAALARSSPDAAPSAELAAEIDDPLARPLFWASALLWTFLIYDMVAKPF